MNKKNSEPCIITTNRKALHDYFIVSTLEAGIKLQGWEVKSIRAGRLQLSDSHVRLDSGNVFLIGSHISPMSNVTGFTETSSSRSRLLLLNKSEIHELASLIGAKGYTCVVLDIHWSNNLVKCKLGLAKGKKQHDKREALKKKDDERASARDVARMQGFK